MNEMYHFTKTVIHFYFRVKSPSHLLCIQDRKKEGRRSQKIKPKYLEHMGIRRRKV